MSQTNHGSIEFLKFPNPQYPGDATKMIKKWLRDSWARRKIVALQQTIAVNDASVLCTVTPIVPTLTTGNHASIFGGCFYYKIGHRVHIHIGVTGLTSGTTATLWYMPAGYRPHAIVGQVGTGQSMTTYGRLRVAPDGMVYINANATGACVDLEYDAFQ